MESDKKFWESLDVEGIMADWISQNAETFVDRNPPKRHRNRKRGTINYWETKWGRLIRDPNVSNPLSAAGKKFRRRFRVPYPVFIEIIVAECRRVNLFKTKVEHLVRIPLEFKVLMSLRLLGRGNCCDDIEDMADIAESSASEIFHVFVEQFVAHFFTTYVKVPTGDRLRKTMAVYEQLGLAGACGSMDCTHLHWNRCPSWLKALCKGKESYPTLSFNCVVDHFRFIHHVSKHYVGTSNDVTICYNDSYTKDIIRGLYAGIVFFIFLASGLLQKCFGGWIIVDGGYPKKACFIDPIKTRFSRQHIMWSEWMESVRKDVECTFSILKNRFRMIRNPIEYQDPEFIEKMFKCCCILHNIILVYDGNSLKSSSVAATCSVSSFESFSCGFVVIEFQIRVATNFH